MLNKLIYEIFVYYEFYLNNMKEDSYNIKHNCLKITC